MVVEDGASEVDTRPRDRSGWVLAAVGFGLGLALGTLIAAPGPIPVAPDVTEPASSNAVAEPPEESSDSGVSGELPEFPDALVAVGNSLGSGHDYLLWPVGGPLVTRSMTGGGDVLLDATGQYIALSEEVPDLPGSLLSIGRFHRIQPVSSGVTGYDWHDSDSGQLAYTIEDDQAWRLYHVSGGFSASLVTTSTPNGGTVAAWGTWGYAIQLPDDRIQLLTRDGEPKDIETGTALASHESGWVLVEDDGLKLVSSGGGVRVLHGADVPDTVLAASFSRDGTRVAVVTRSGVMLVDLNDRDRVTIVPGYPGSWVTWSSDSRFVVSPARSGVSVYDVLDEETHNVLFGRDILVAQSVALSSRQDG
jgi:hypothetical protein